MQIFDVFGLFRMEGVEDSINKVNKVGTSIKNAGNTISGFGAKLTAGVSLPLAGLAVAGVKYNATVQSLQTSFKVLLGSEDEAIKLTDKLKKVGAETPFEITGLADASKTLLAFGVEQDKLIPTMTRIGDVSLGNNEAFQSMSRVMGQVNALGKLQGGDLNQLINWGWNPLNEITERTGESMEDVRKRMSEGKVTYKEVEQALKDATSEGGRFYKGMEEGSKTFEGRLSTLSDVFHEFLGTATKPLFDYLSNTAIPAIINLFENFNKLDAPIRNGAVIFGVIAAIIPPLIVAFGGIVSIVGTVVAAITAISAPVLIVVGTITIVIGALTAWGAALIAIAEKTGLLSKGIDYLKGLISGVVSIIKGDVTNAMEIFQEKMGMSKEEAAKFALKINTTKENIIKLISVVKDVTALIKAIFDGDAQKIVNILITKFGLSKDEAIKFKNRVFELKDKIVELGGKIKDLATSALKTMIDYIQRGTKFIIEHKDQIIKLISKFVEFGEKAVKNISNVIEFLGDLGSKAKENIETVINLVKSAYEWFNDMKDSVNGVISAIKNIKFPSPPSWLSAVIPSFATGVENFAGGMAMVGERGRELVFLPRGSTVVPNQKTEELMAGLNTTSAKYSTAGFSPIMTNNTNNNNNSINIGTIQINPTSIKSLQDLIDIFSSLGNEYSLRGGL